MVTTVSHLNTAVCRLHLQGGEVLGTTRHPLFYSFDRKDWVHAESLRKGEKLKTNGGELSVGDIEFVVGSHMLYNIEVE